MPARLVSILLLLLIVPAFSQQGSVATTRVDQWIWSRGRMMKADTPPELAPSAAQLKAIHDDAEQLVTLSASLQSDLQQLQKGMLARDLIQNLKKVEKISKKLRQEVSQ